MNWWQGKTVGVFTPDQFDEAVKSFPRMSDTGKDAARLVLVDGLAPAAVAARFEIHRQQVHRWAKQVFEAGQVSDGN